MASDVFLYVVGSISTAIIGLRLFFVFVVLKITRTLLLLALMLFSGTTPVQQVFPPKRFPLLYFLFIICFSFPIEGKKKLSSLLSLFSSFLSHHSLHYFCHPSLYHSSATTPFHGPFPSLSRASKPSSGGLTWAVNIQGIKGGWIHS